MKMWSTTVGWLRGLAALWSGLIAAGVALQHLQILPPLPKIEPWVWAVSLAIIAVDNIGTLLTRRVQSRSKNIEQKLDRVAVSLILAYVRAQPGLRFEELGVSFYRPTRMSRLLRRAHLSNGVQLDRVRKYRPGDDRRSGVKWSNEKGVVGACWSGRKSVYKNVHHISKSWRDVDAISDAKYRSMSPETTQGFDRDEFLATVGKYSEVLAEPIWDNKKDTKLLGVLSVDRSFVTDDDHYKPLLDDKSSGTAAAAAASAAGRILSGNDDDEQ